jgi:hypothetical protein
MAFVEGWARWKKSKTKDKKQKRPEATGEGVL